MSRGNGRHGLLLYQSYNVPRLRKSNLSPFSGPVRSVSENSLVAMDFSGRTGRVIDNPVEAQSAALEEGQTWRKRSQRMNVLGSPSPLHPSTLSTVIHRTQIWFHGRILREEAHRMILQQGQVDGLFLLRDSQSNPKAFVLTLCHHQKIKHFQILPASDSCIFSFLHLWLEATLDEAPDSAHGPGVGLVLPPVDEGDEAGGVQAALGAAVRGVGLQPRLLEAEPGGGPPARVGPQQQADEVPGPLADALEVIPGEAEVQPADVQARLLGALVQEGGGAAQQHVGHHAQAPQVRGQRHGLLEDQLRRGELGAAQQRVDVVEAVELRRVAEVRQFDRRLAAGAVGHQQVLRLEERCHTTPLDGWFVSTTVPPADDVVQQAALVGPETQTPQHGLAALRT
ncbi:Growth factor receptor-bound protein 10 [Liparis tanakae]|uniref:Growth factor receptor-bound protein 10 n=1 Tax=Liparis tanakae TaxID=230148 RepID=A0A4Z2GNH6_9TELE|nr:Growth factor receptor-bound protein 10 [Liparis tanakae]